MRGCTAAAGLSLINVNVRHVQETLGHCSPATTERYLQLTIAGLKAAHQQFHPRERGVHRASLKGALITRNLPL